MHELHAANETVFMLSSRIEQLQAEVRRLTHAIKENAYTTNGNQRLMHGWARQALGEEVHAPTTTPVSFFEAW